MCLSSIRYYDICIENVINLIDQAYATKIAFRRVFSQLARVKLDRVGEGFSEGIKVVRCKTVIGIKNWK